MLAAQVEVHRLDESRRSDFFRVHSEAAGGGWCHCVAWWTPTWEGWGDRTAEENRRLRADLFDRGEYDGYLLYFDGNPVGWCQVGPRDRLEKLARQYGLAADPAAWAITCFLIAPSHRRQSLARQLLIAVLEDLRARGIRRVEAFPKRGENLETGDLWTGPESLFLSAGFSVARDHPSRPVLARDL